MIKRILLLSMAAVAFLVATTVLIMNREFTDPVLDEHGDAISDSLAVIDRVNLGGIEQSLVIRGAQADLPVLLWLHGGPGSPELPFAREFNADLERRFLVVHWDQRGAGKSYYEGEDLPPEQMRLRENYVADTIELSERLIRRFRTDATQAEKKIYLFGHSWGALVGILAAQRRPDLFHAFIAAGQPVRMAESERRSYEWALQQSREQKNADAIAELEAIGTPPYSGETMAQKTPVHWKWVMQHGGALYGRDSIASLLPILFFCDEYNLVDKVAFVQGGQRTARIVWDELMAANLFAEVPALAVRTVFIHGRHDRQVDGALTEEYFRGLRAPEKTWIWFEASAHSPMFEEPGRFTEVLADLLTSK